jgi:hypothetical protein
VQTLNVDAFNAEMLSSLSMQMVRPAAWAILFQLEAALRVLTILLSRIIALLALGASQRNHNAICFLLSSHLNHSTLKVEA